MYTDFLLEIFTTIFSMMNLIHLLERTLIHFLERSSFPVASLEWCRGHGLYRVTCLGGGTTDHNFESLL